MNKMRIRALEISAFRGYGSRYRFEFPNVDALILYGPNGHGKTSFFDAIEWALTGKLSRFDDKSDERRRSRFVGNRFSNESPEVLLELVDNAESSIRVHRIGTASSSQQSDYGHDSLKLIVGEELFEGNQAESKLAKLLIRNNWEGRVSVEQGLSLTHLLSQERISHILRGMKDKDRYDAFSLLFGTEHFKRYADEFQMAKRILQDKKTEVKSQFDSATQVLNHYKGDLELRKGSSAQSDLTELKTVYARYQQVYARTGNSDDVERDEIKNQLAIDRTQLRKRNETLKDQRTDLNAAVDEFNIWKQNEPHYRRSVQALERFKQLDLLDIEAQELQWLHDRLIQYETNEEKIEKLSIELDTYRQSVREKEMHLQFLTPAISIALELVRSARDRMGDLTEICDRLTAVVNEFPDDTLDNSMKVPLDSAIASLRASYLTWKQLRETYESSSKVVDQCQNALNQLLIHDQKYNEFLHEVHAFVSENLQLDRCPTCGTKGITSEHILRYIGEKQNQLDPSLSEVERKLDEARQNSARHLEATNAAQTQYEFMVNTFEQHLKNLEHLLTVKRGSIQDSEGHIERLLKDLESTRQLGEEFQRRTLRIDMDPSSLNIRHSLGRRMDELQQRKNHVLELLEIAYRENWRKHTPLIQTKVDEYEKMKQETFVSLRDIGLSRVGTEQQSELNAEIESYFRERRDDMDRQGRVLADLEQVSMDLATAIERVESSILLKDLETKVANQKKVVLNLDKKLQQLTKDLEVVDDVITNVPAAIDKLNERALKELFNLIQGIYTRINPHPVFRELRYSKNQNFGSNRLLLSVYPDQTEGFTGANPSFVFSAAQINGIALSFFLAMAISQQWSPLDVVAMDDPVQSMDDLNVSFLTDFIRSLCRSASGAKQFIVSTHDDSFYQLMLTKLRHLNIGVIEFSGFTKEGPILAKDETSLFQSGIRVIPSLSRQIEEAELWKTLMGVETS